MADVVLKNICKVYQSRDRKQKEGFLAVDNFNLEIQNNEFVVFVGPSGCGKSTTLRMIAGLENITSGELYIDGQFVNDAEPKNRDIAMVFQNYALYPHMTAYKNIAFGLTLRKIAVPVLNDEPGAAELQIKNKEILQEISSAIKVIRQNADKLEGLHKKEVKLKGLKEELDEEMAQDVFKSVHNVKAQELLGKLKVKADDLQAQLDEVKAAQAQLIEESDSLSDHNEELYGQIAANEEACKPYQVYSIDQKAIKKAWSNLRYYENLAKKDEKIKNSDAEHLEQTRLKIAEIESQIADLTSEAQGGDISSISSKINDLEFERDQLNQDFEFFTDELQVLEKRAISIQAGIDEAKNRIEYYTNNEQPVYKYRHYTKDEIDRKIRKAAKVLDIESLLQRKPREMSGGQRQRIALGRAIVREPKVFLLDEPLSNLDAKLRAAMRVEISRLHDSLKTTFIYVTHDQIEAMTMGDRIVVMKDGVIQQIDNPTNLFDYPVNVFVAGFIGTPQMNFFNVSIKKDGEKLAVKYPDGTELAYNLQNMRPIDEKYLDGQEHEAILGIRAENLRIVEKGVPASVKFVEILGNDTQIYLNANQGRLDENGEAKETIVKLSTRPDYKEGHIVNIDADEANIHLFDKETTLSIMGKRQ